MTTTAVPTSRRLGQPWLGVVATAAVVVVSLAFISLFPWPTFRDQVSYLLVCAVPFAFLVGIFWRGEHPRAVASLPQPWRGIAYLGLTAVVAVVVAVVHLLTIGGGVTPPTPMVAQCVIMSVPVAFLMMVLWGGWPFTLVTSPVLGGVLLLVTAYVVNAVAFRALASYAAIRGSPAYVEPLDPQGPVDAWLLLVFAVTCMGWTLVLVHVDLGPLGRMASAHVRGLVGTLVVALLSGLTLLVLVRGLGIAAPDVLTGLTAPFLFGTIIVLSMLEGSAFLSRPQPVRGLLTVLTALLVGEVLARVYVLVSPWVSGEIAWGAPEFQGEVWLASALLGVTFPFLAFHSDYFHLWPLRRARDPQPAGASEL